MLIISLILGILSIYIVLNGENRNHYLYSLYLSICSSINYIINDESLFEIIKNNIIDALLLFGLIFIILFPINLISYKFSSNTASSKFTYFLKFSIIQIVLFVVVFYVLGYINDNIIN